MAMHENIDYNSQSNQYEPEVHYFSCKQIKSTLKHNKKTSLKQYDSAYARTRSAANFRERRRMQCLNEAFEGLRTHIPSLPYEKRLSKIDTLKLAISYIQFLADLIKDDEEKKRISSSSTNQNPEKILIYNTSIEYTNNNGQSLRLKGHSLSWKSNKPKCNGGVVKTRKIWRPELPEK
ncbi:pancreas transcription factor 1 subunit alpha [Hydra vulgaris]|uniref:Pancreas transcription factor 1 subunit alpha n=1 Tax=Hydra vulgaris TaxID=6087 RepID=A0ABM4CWS9_HYDVU